MQTIETNPIDRFVNVTVLRSGDHVFYNLVFFVTIFMSIVTVSIPFLASAQTPPSATAPAGRLSTLPTTETDQATQSLLNAVIARDSSLTEMKAEVSSGVVYLSGDVDSQKKLDWVNGIAQRLPNVLAVDNDLKIRGVALDGMEPVLGEVNRLILRLKQNLPILLFAVLFLALSYFLSSALNRGVRSLLGRKISNPFVLSIVTRLVLLPVWVLLFYLALRLLGLSALGATLIGGTGV
ncbi:MAG: BON domain-containing protein, partial [Bdellovibrionota bacterium]